MKELSRRTYTDSLRDWVALGQQHVVLGRSAWLCTGHALRQILKCIATAALVLLARTSNRRRRPRLGIVQVDESREFVRGNEEIAVGAHVLLLLQRLHLRFEGVVG